MADESNVNHPYISLAYDLDRLMRSQVLYEAIALESALERLIAFHFCPATEKHDMFVSVLFRDGEVTFSQKIKMLRRILKVCYPSLAKAFAFLPNHLDRLRKLRNDFAHLPLDIPNEPTIADLHKEEVKLRIIQDGQKTTRVVRQQDVDTMIRQCRDLEMAMIFLVMVVRKAAKGEDDPEFAATVAEIGVGIRERLHVSKPRA